ncbi:MAG: hypothetical protein Q8Q89_03010 [bacterium]|nr:hypothetical protein [bacterium]
MNDRNYYVKLRNKYLPEKIKIVFILESPPKSGLYFYKKEGRTTEPLFSAMMRYVLKYKPENKKDGLVQFKKAGLFLMDATYRQINHLPIGERDRIILDDFPLLIRDLKKVVRRNEKLILVKSNICRILENKLGDNGFTVINRGTIVPFPATGNQLKFKQKISKILKNTVG